MSERDHDTDEGLSTDVGNHLESGTRIGAVPGQDATVDISGGAGQGTGAGAWPNGMGTQGDPADGARGDDDTGAGARDERIGERHGELADSGVSTGPVGHGDG